MSKRFRSAVRRFVWLGAIGAASLLFVGQGLELIGQGSTNGQTNAVAVFAAPLSGHNDNHPAPAPAAPPAPVCSTPGQEMAFTSADGKITVRVFPTMNRPVRLTIRPVEPGTVPGLPGTLVDRIVFEILADFCDGGGAIAVLPAEVNLAIRYTNEDAAGLNRPSFMIAQLDSVSGQWAPTPKQAGDPASNFSSATIQRLGFYALYQPS